MKRQWPEKRSFQGVVLYLLSHYYNYQFKQVNLLNNYLTWRCQRKGWVTCSLVNNTWLATLWVNSINNRHMSPITSRENWAYSGVTVTVYDPWKRSLCLKHCYFRHNVWLLWCNFVSLYSFGGENKRGCMDFEPCFKFYNLVSVYPKTSNLVKWLLSTYSFMWWVSL